MTYDELRKKLVQSATKQNIPISGEFELTSFCNLNCKMCFVKELYKQKELSTSEWIRIIKEAKEAGMLFALFTGGEIFTRADFKEIYETTYDLGVKIVLFTNGTLINESIIKMLVRRPPDYVAITLYGVSNETYEKITGKKNGFDIVFNSIRLLKEHNIKLKVRTIAIQEMYQEINEIITFVKEEGLDYDYSLYVGPRRDKCSDNCFSRLTPEQLTNYQKIHEQEFNVIENVDFKDSDNGFNCVAGKSAFFVNWKGEMTPCAMLSVPSLTIKNFLETWKEFIKKVNEVPNCKACFDCVYKHECIQCPARRYLENGFEKCNKYLKDYAKIRYYARQNK